MCRKGYGYCNHVYMFVCMHDLEKTKYQIGVIFYTRSNKRAVMVPEVTTDINY